MLQKPCESDVLLERLPQRGHMCRHSEQRQKPERRWPEPSVLVGEEGSWSAGHLGDLIAETEAFSS